MGHERVKIIGQSNGVFPLHILRNTRGTVNQDPVIIHSIAEIKSCGELQKKFYVECRCQIQCPRTNNFLNSWHLPDLSLGLKLTPSPKNY